MSLARAPLHYLAAFAVLGVYGVQVCPFIESLTPFQLAMPLALIITGQYLARLALQPVWVERAPFKRQVGRSFQMEWGLFFLGGLALTAWNSLHHDFPLESGLKMVLGFTTLGLFAAIDLALEHDDRLAERFRRDGISLTPDRRYFPLVTKFSLFAALSALFLVGIFFLVVVKDLEWLTQVGDTLPKATAHRSVLGEFAFIGALLTGYLLVVIFSYARNLNRLLDGQNRVLGEATAGQLDGAVTVSSNDEFGVMGHHTNVMIETLRGRTEELARTRDATILSLASLAETRDNETGAHLLRTQRYVRALAEELRDHPRFSDRLDDETIELLYKSAPLHDIGKVGIPDRILLKPGKLTDEEFEIMKTHAALGAEALAVAEKALGGSSFLRYAREIAGSHHEKWDGGGYPAGLAGDAIPLSGRLMAVADVYDALISKRVYKEAFGHERAMTIIREGRGGHFDPDIVDALERIEERFIEIAARYADSGHEAAA